MTRAPTSEAPAGTAIIRAFKQAGVGHVLAVPDIVTSDGLLWPISRDPELELVRVCKEDEAISIAAGLSFAGRRALVLIQNTGLFDSINSLRAMAGEYRLPICLMVGLQGKEPDVLPRDSTKYAVRIVEPMLDLMQIEHRLVQEPSDVATIAPGIEAAYTTPKPLVFVVGRSPRP